MQEFIFFKFRDVSNVLQEIYALSGTEFLGNFANANVEELKSHQAAVKLLKVQQLKQILDKKDEIINNCKELIRSASPTVSTNVLVFFYFLI